MTIFQRNSESTKREKQLLASFIADFKKGKKTANPMKYARTCRALVNMYGSPQSVSEKLGVGRETVRILSKILDLPSEVQELISQRKIPITVAFDLVPLDSDKQIEVAKAVLGLSFKDARRIIRRLSEDPHLLATTVRTEVLSELEKKEVNIAMIALPREIYRLLQKESRDVPELIRSIVVDWLAKDHPLGDHPHAVEKANLVSVTIGFPRRTFMALRRKTRKPANLVERIVIGWLKQKGKIK